MMKLNVLLGLVLFAFNAHASDMPPFHSLECEVEGLPVQIEIQYFRASTTSGPASVTMGGVSYGGGWSWTPTMVNTRFPFPQGYHALEVVGHESAGSNEFHAHITVDSSDQIYGISYVDTGDGLKPTTCNIADVVEKPSYQCKVAPQNDCSVSPKRLCCDCEDGKQSCY